MLSFNRRPFSDRLSWWTKRIFNTSSTFALSPFPPPSLLLFLFVLLMKFSLSFTTCPFLLCWFYKLPTSEWESIRVNLNTCLVPWGLPDDTLLPRTVTRCNDREPFRDDVYGIKVATRAGWWKTTSEPFFWYKLGGESSVSDVMGVERLVWKSA